MREVRYFYVPQAASQTSLPDEEAQHALRVLRLKEGDEMMLMDGEGCFYRAAVTLATNHRCMYEIRETMEQTPQWQGRVRLAIAPTKMMERMEWLVEKATEIGIDEFSFLRCQFSERDTVKTARLEKIVISAVKQSRKAWMPVINEMIPFRQFISQQTSGRRYIAHCYGEIPRVNLMDELVRLSPDEDVLILVGPEGDFSVDEVRTALEAGFVSVDLGKSRLRTETAGLSAVMTVQLAKNMRI